MNKLLKIKRLLILSVFALFSSGLLADQGMLSSLDSNTTFGNITLDLVYENNKINAITSANLEIYNADGTGLISSSIAASSTSLVVDSSYVYIGTGVGMEIHRTSDANTTGAFDQNIQTRSIAINSSATYSFLATQDKITVVSMDSNKSTITKVTDIDVVNAQELVVKGNYLYLADDWGGLKVADISNPEILSFSLVSNETFYSLSIENDYLYTLGSTGLSIYDISSPAAPIKVGTTFEIANVAADDTIDIYDLTAYVSLSSKLKAYDVANKLSISEINAVTTANITSVVTTASEDFLYVSNTASISKYFAYSDFKNNFTDAKNDATAKNFKGFSQDDLLTSNGGVTGVILDSTINDIDYIKLNLPSGKFISTLSGIDDLGVALYDDNNNLKYSDFTNTSIKDISVELTSGSYYLKVASNSNTIGQYKLQANFTTDDWTGSKTSATLINFNESIRGNIQSSSDDDYFRVDLTSKGDITIQSYNADVVKFEIYNSYDNSIISGDTKLYADGKNFSIPRAGIYFIKASGANEDVDNKDYKFTVDFSKTNSLAREDEAQLALTSFDTNTFSSTTFNLMKGEGDYVYITQANKLEKKSKTDLNTTLNDLNTTYSIEDMTIVGDYIYITQAKTIEIYNKTLGAVATNIPEATNNLNKIKVNAERIYATDGSNIYIYKTSTIGSITLDATVSVGSINDFDVKTSFILNADASYSMHTYLYLATNTGLKIKDVTDETNIVDVQTYKDGESFNNITISNPYAYVKHGDDFKILYIKKPTSTPKLKGTLKSVGSLKEIVVNENYAYLVGTNESVDIVDILDQTLPYRIELDTVFIKAKAIAVDDGVAYVVKSNTEIQKYDISKDYADVKGNALDLKYDESVYGVISTNRPADVDMFYIGATSSMKLDFNGTSDKDLTYEFYNFNDDATPLKTFNSSANATSFSTYLSEGEYYLKVFTTTASESGTYNFKVTKTEDDYGDTFTNTTQIEFSTDVSGNLFDSGSDKDFFKIVVNDRAELTITGTSSINTKISLFYDDGSTLILVDTNNVIATIVNPGTYYVVVEGDDSTVKGDYTLNVEYKPNGELTLPSGIDEILNFNAAHIVYGPRYIYVIDKDNNLVSYNHLLKKLATNGIETYDNIQVTCSEPLFYNNKIYINFGQKDNNVITCTNGYIALNVESTEDGEGTYSDYIPNNKQYKLSDTQYITGSEINVVAIEDGYLFEYAKDSGGNYNIYRTAYSQISEYNPDSLGGLTLGAASIDDVKDIATTKDNVFIALNGTLYVMPFDMSSSTTIAFVGEISKLYADTSREELYVIDGSTKLKKVVRGSTVATNVIELDYVPNDMYVLDGKIYISFAEHGIKIYDIAANALKPLENIGKNLAKPFSFDGSTVNYTSENQLKVFFLEESFIDGSTTGTYSIVDGASVSEGEGCFIATAAYGSYFQKNVKVLRDFRDDYLLNNFMGRVFVEFYYANSPSIAQEISKSEVAKGIIRVVLTPIVYSIKYPLLALSSLLFLVMFMMRKHFSLTREFMRRLVVIPMLVVLSFTFSGCDDEGDNYSRVIAKTPPVIRSFLTNIDTNNTNISNIEIGRVGIESLGGAEILSFRLDGAGSSNFDIDKAGIITTRANTELNCTTASKYDLKAIATNTYGDSNRVDALIQVNCMDAPVTYDTGFFVQEQSTTINATIGIKRISSPANSGASISEIRLYGEGADKFSVSASGVVSLTNNNPLDYEEKSSYTLTARAINSLGKIGPHTRVDVTVGDIDENYTGTTTTGGYNDDYPNWYTDVTYTTFYNGGSVSANIDFTWDSDYFKVEISKTSNVTLNINAYGYNQNLDVYLGEVTGENSLSHKGSTSVYGSGSFTVENLAPGTYYIGASSSETGSYYISLDVTDSGVTVNSPSLVQYVIKTLQTASFDGSGTEVMDSSLHDDGYYQSGVLPDFTKSGDIVTDNITGRMWQDNNDTATITKPWLETTNYTDCSNDSSSLACYDVSGDTAATYCATLSLDGYTDWRLPTRVELQSIVDYSKSYPAMSPIFTNFSSNYYWSSTTVEGYPSGAWNVYFSSGTVNSSYKDNSRYVRCVRAGQ